MRTLRNRWLAAVVGALAALILAQVMRRRKHHPRYCIKLCEDCSVDQRAASKELVETIEQGGAGALEEGVTVVCLLAIDTTTSDVVGHVVAKEGWQVRAFQSTVEDVRRQHHSKTKEELRKWAECSPLGPSWADSILEEALFPHDGKHRPKPFSLEMSSLVVDPRHRRQGIGGALATVTCAMAAVTKKATEINGLAASDNLACWYCTKLGHSLPVKEHERWIELPLDTDSKRRATFAKLGTLPANVYLDSRVEAALLE